MEDISGQPKHLIYESQGAGLQHERGQARAQRIQLHNAHKVYNTESSN